MNVAPARYFVVALLVVTAGCLGFDGAGPQGTATERPTQQATGTISDTQSEDDAASGGAIARQHRETLVERGSVTVRSSTTRTTSAGGESQTVQQERVSRFSLTDGRYLDSLDPLGGDPSVSYRTADGTVVSRLGSEGDYTYTQRAGSRTVNVTDRIRVPVVDDGALENRGQGTVDGVSGTVYVVDEFAAVRGIYEGVRPTDVTAFEMTAVVADDHVTYLRLDVTVTIDDQTLSQTSRTHYADVGTTTVDRPAWVDRALDGPESDTE